MPFRSKLFELHRSRCEEKKDEGNRRPATNSVDLILYPGKRPRGEDPPTEFLCVCRNYLSIRRIRLIWRWGFFEILTAGHIMSSNYYRCAMFGPWTSTDTLRIPEDKCSFGILSGAPLTRSGVPRAMLRAGMPPEVRRFYCGLLDDICQWTLIRIFGIPLVVMLSGNSLPEK